MKFIEIDGKRINSGDIISDIRGDRYRFLYLSSGGRKLFCESLDGIMKREFYPSVFNAVVMEDIPKEDRPHTNFDRARTIEKYGDKNNI